MAEKEHTMTARIFHYLHWIAMALLGISGIYIHRPFAPNLMGVMRYIHFVSMYVLIYVWIARLYWAIFGTPRDILKFLPQKENRGKLMPIISYYLFIKKEHPKTAEYNPLQKTTYGSWLLLVLCQAFTGFALYWPNSSYFSWLTNAVGGLGMVRTIHYLTMWLFIITVAIHIYLSLAEDFAAFLNIFFAAKVKEKAK